MIQAYGFGFGHRFVFGDSLWLQVYVSASGVCLDIRESIANARMHDSLGSGIFRESREKSGVL